MRKIVAASLLLLTVVFSANASVECLSGMAAKNAFVADQTEPYFSLLQTREISAKTGGRVAAGTPQLQREQVRAIYLESVEDCTPDDLKGLEGYLAIIESSLKPVYPGLVAQPWRFIKVRDHIEGGLPHTRTNVIVLSESLFKSIVATARAQQWQLGIMDILIHEQVHVIQRVKPGAFETLYEQQWGFIKAPSIRGAEDWLAAHQIVNPDGIDVQWVWPVPGSTRVIWPRVILAGESDAPAMPDDFRMVGIELARTAEGYSVPMGKKHAPRYRDLSEEPAYMEKFAGINSLYHPNEIAADYLAGLALWDCLVNKNKASAGQRLAMEERFKPIRAWAQQTFAKD